MGKTAFAGLVLALVSFQASIAQSIVFVSPSTKGLLSMSCAAGSLDSFEELQYLATAHYLAGQLCRAAKVDGGVGLWKGQAENSGSIDGCPNDRARQLGALLARYYHQKAALVFDRDPQGRSWLVSFTAGQPVGVIGAMMAQAQVSGATVIPHLHDNLVLMVATNPEQRAQAMKLYGLVHGNGWQEQAGTKELIGDEDRAKAREIYDRILAQASPEVQQLGKDMYSKSFADLGLQDAPAR